MSHEALIWTFLSGAIVYLVLSSVLKSRLPSRNNPSQAPKSQYGLVRVSEGVESMRGGTDIIFVHGLGSNPDTTWWAKPTTATKDVASPSTPSARLRPKATWVTELLLADMPDDLRESTSIFFYNYNSWWVRDALVFRMKHISKDLLGYLAVSLRNSHGRRSIVFVAHSYGGLVVKRAIADARATNPEILGATQGIIFLGCPHRGSKMAGLGKPTAAVLRYLLARPNIDILSELEYDDPHLMDLHEDFRRASSGHPLKTVNFFEQKPTQYFPFYRILTVPESSATFEGASDNLPLPVDHSGLNKFASAHAPGYAAVRNQIVEVLIAAQENHKARLRARHIVPERPVSTYTERKALKEELVAVLNEQTSLGHLAHAVAVVGAGGMGKTQLVLSYIRDFGHQYDAILWIDARSRQSVRASFRNACSVLNITITITNTANDVEFLRDEPEVRATLYWLANRTRPGEDWLMIIDNADDLQLGLTGIVPRGSRGSAVVTSRDATSGKLLGHQTPRIDVDCMTATEGEKLLLQGLSRYSELPDDGISSLVSQLVTKLGMMPLAIDLAAAYILETTTGNLRSSLSEYLDDYCCHQDQVLSGGTTNAMGSNEISLATVWDASIAMIQTQSTSAGLVSSELLLFITLFDFHNVQQSIFEYAALGLSDISPNLPSDTLALPSWLVNLTRCRDDGSWDSFYYRKSVALLQRYGMIRATTKPAAGISMHDLVHWRSSRDIRDKRLWDRHYLTFLVAACSHLINREDANGVRSQADLLAHLPSLKALRHTLRGLPGDEKAFMYYTIGRIWEVQEHLQEAHAHYSQAGKAAAAALGEDALDTLVYISRLAAVCNKMGRHDRALELQLQVVQDLVDTVGNGNYETVRATSTLASIYRALGLPEKAHVQYQAVYVGFLRTLGPDHLVTVDSMETLADSHRTVGELEAAEQLGREVLVRRKAILGPYHPTTITTITELALTCRLQRRLEQALALDEEAVELGVEHLGTMDLVTLRSRLALALTYCVIGRFSEGVSMAREGYEGTVKLLGATHYEALSAMSVVGVCLHGAGRYDEAREMLTKAVELLTEHYGATNSFIGGARALLRSYFGEGRAAEVNTHATAGAQS